MSERLDIHPVTPQPRLIERAAQRIEQGALAVLPSDAGYLLAWELDARDAEAQAVRIRALDTRHPFTLLCNSLSGVGRLAKLDDQAFRLIKALTPGPVTFILPAASELPRRLKQAKRQAVGVRIPDHTVLRALIDRIESPLLVTSLTIPGEDLDSHDPDAVAEHMMRHVDLMVDSGPCPIGPTTVIDCLGSTPTVTRQGFQPIDID